MEWISVKDRLPKEDNEEYFLFTDGITVLYGRYYDGNSYYDECLWKADNGGFLKNTDITHWMPLPNPPKED